jgi:hypothetical protein
MIVPRYYVCGRLAPCDGTNLYIEIVVPRRWKFRPGKQSPPRSGSEYCKYLSLPFPSCINRPRSGLFLFGSKFVWRTATYAYAKLGCVWQWSGILPYWCYVRKRKFGWTKASYDGPNHGNASPFIIRYRFWLHLFLKEIYCVLVYFQDDGLEQTNTHFVFLTSRQ